MTHDPWYEPPRPEAAPPPRPAGPWSLRRGGGGRRLRRAAPWILGIAAFLAVALAGATWWVTGTQSGARWGFERLGAIVPGELDVKEMRGPLRGPLEVRHLVYRNDRMEITVDRLVLHWRLSDLLRRRLDIQRLHAEDVRVLMGAAGDTPAERDSLDDGLADVDLPVSIVVRDGIVEGLQITTPGDPEGLVIDRVVLDGRSFEDSLQIRRLAVESRAFDAELSGRALPVGRYPLALEGRWTFRPEGGEEFTGEGTVAGELGGTLRVSQRVDRPFAFVAEGTILRLLRAPRVEGDVTFERFAPRTLDPGYPEGTFSGRLHVTGRIDDLAGHGTIMSRTEALGLAHTDVRFRRRGATWLVDNLYLTLPGTALELTGRGSVTGTGDAARMRFDARWRNLDWPLRGTPVFESERGTALLEGTPRAFDVRLEALLAGRDLPPGRWWLDGHGGDGRLTIRTVIADILDGRITGNGAVRWAPRVEWRLGLEGHGIDPGSVWRDWNGSVAFTGRSEGAMTRRGPVGTVLVSRLGGTLRGDTLAGGGTLVARGPGYTLRDAAVVWGRDTVAAAGDLVDRWDLAFRVAAPDLGQLPQGSGSLFAEGTVRGAGGRPHLVTTVRGESLFYQRYHATTLRAAGDLDFAPGGALHLDAAATELDVGEHSFARVIATIRGTQARHEARAAVTGTSDSLVAALAGGWNRGTWRGQLVTFDLVKRETGNWSLGGPAALTASTREMTLAGFEWRSGASRLALEADWDAAGPWRVDSRLDSVRLALFEPFLPADLRMTGNLHGRILARATADRLFADVDLVPGPGEISHLTADGRWVPTRFENGVLRAGADGRGLSATVALDLVNVGTVRGSVTMPQYAVLSRPARGQPLDGRLAVHLRDLALLQGLSPELEATAGSLDADLQFGGTLANPAVEGDLQVRNGAADVSRFGLQLREITLHAIGASGGKLAVQGSMMSGGGRLRFDGTADLGAGAKPQARLAVQGDRVQAIHTRETRIVVSPDLLVTLSGRRVDLNGEVRVPEGTIELSRGERRAVRPSRDVVYAAPDSIAPGALEVYSRVRIVLGDNVRLRGYGVDLKSSGSVLATDAPGMPTLASGELTAREGRYRIYGQELAIERGRLIFGGGPIVNPGLDIRASRRTDDGTVAGFEVRGTLQQPDLQVFSDPQRGQSQALAYILFGRPVERTNLQQGQLVSTMATTMGVGGTEMLAHGVASGLGIEEVRVHAGADLQSTSLMLGTHLSPKLYLSYGLGLFESQPVVQLRYVIDRRWTIEAETARQSRVDLMFTVER